MTKKNNKRPLDFEYFYNLMMSEKIAHETSEATLSRIKIIWKKSIAPYWKRVLPKDIDQRMITNFINWHRENRPGIQLVNVFKYLGNIMSVMIESGAMDMARKPKLELPMQEQKHHAKQKGRYIADEEFYKIVSNTSGWFKLYLLTLYTSGFRKMELGKLEVSRLKKIDNRYVAILTTDDTKTGRAREVPFSELLTPLVEEQLLLGSSYLFPSVDKSRHISPQAIDQKWKLAKAAAGIEGKMRIHDLRHSCASNLAKDAVNPIVVVTSLGMSLAMFQKTYLKLNAQDLFIASDSSNKRIKI